MGSQVILVALCAPSALLITFFVLYELYYYNATKVRMAVVITLAAIVALFEKLDTKYNKAAKELE